MTLGLDAEADICWLVLRSPDRLGVVEIAHVLVESGQRAAAVPEGNYLANPRNLQIQRQLAMLNEVAIFGTALAIWSPSEEERQTQQGGQQCEF
jgi:hypothetical protein